MKCPRCSVDLSDRVNFCPNCGQDVAPLFQQPAVQDQPLKKGGALLVAGSIFLVVALGLGAVVSLQRVRPPVRPSLPVVTETPAPVVRREAKDQMPADVRAWLEHLERTEVKRVELAQDQVRRLTRNLSEFQVAKYTEAFKDLLGGDPTDDAVPENTLVEKAADIAGGIKPAWTELAKEFRSKSPPEECVTIHDDYDQALSETGATVGDIIQILFDLGQSPDAAIPKLEGIMKRHKEMIDRPAANADRLVQDICDKYGTRKWFSIKGDIGSGGMLTGIPNLGGLSP